MSWDSNVKAHPGLIVRAHWSTLVDARTGNRRWQDVVLFLAPPIVVTSTCLLVGVKLPTAATAAFLTVSGLLGAFLFGVMLQIYERAYVVEDARPERGERTTAYVKNLEELAANSAYAALTCVVAATVFAVATATSGWALRVSSALGLGLETHLGLVLLMVMRRLFLRTQDSLNRALTGSHRVDPKRSRAA